MKNNTIISKAKSKTTEKNVEVEKPNPEPKNRLEQLIALMGIE